MKTRRPPRGWIQHCIAHVQKGHRKVKSAGAVCGALWKKMSRAAKLAAKKRHPERGRGHRKGK